MLAVETRLEPAAPASLSCDFRRQQQFPHLNSFSITWLKLRLFFFLACLTVFRCVCVCVCVCACSCLYFVFLLLRFVVFINISEISKFSLIFPVSSQSCVWQLFIKEFYDNDDDDDDDASHLNRLTPSHSARSNFHTYTIHRARHWGRDNYSDHSESVRLIDGRAASARWCGRTRFRC